MVQVVGNVAKQPTDTKAPRTDDGWVAAAGSPDLKDKLKLEKRASLSQAGFGGQVSGLVETDPFATNDTVRCKAC